MNHYIGMDAGGTKTEAVLTDERGHIVSRLYGRGCNPMDNGPEAVRSTVLDAANALLKKAPDPVVSLYGGIAGLDRIDIGLDEFLRARLPIPSIRTEDDGFSLISGVLGHVDGCGMVCGTGSSLFARLEGRPPLHIGGLGYLIDTGGSGYALGRQALERAFRYLDGRDSYTVLPELLSRALGKELRQSFLEIYSGGRPFIASLAPTVFEGAAMGDTACKDILEEGSARLAELAAAASLHFDGEFPVVMNGGILRSYPDYADKVRAKAPARARMILAEAPPVYGAVVEALWQAGAAATEVFRRTFMEDYRRLSR